MLPAPLPLPALERVPEPKQTAEKPSKPKPKPTKPKIIIKKEQKGNHQATEKNKRKTDNDDKGLFKFFKAKPK